MTSFGESLGRVGLKKSHIFFMILGFILMVIDFLFFSGKPYFIPLLVIALILGWLQFLLDFFVGIKKRKEIEQKFPEFIRNLVGAIKSGMPAPKAIIHVANTDYGALTPYVKKLANQLEWSIPLHKALQTFAKDTRNQVISRAIDIVIEAEKSGGNIEDVLESITLSVINIRKAKQQREASINSQIVQSYIIFFVFLGVMVIIQNLLMPYILSMQMSTIPGLEGGDIGTSIIPEQDNLLSATTINFSSIGALFSSLTDWFVSMRGVFVMIAVIQGFFAGIVLGKLAEGQVSAGFKHSLILVTIGIIIMSFAQGLL